MTTSDSKSAAGEAPVMIALLRGINVGGRNKVAMSGLRELMGELGHQDVGTYIQSGNVVFRPGESVPPAQLSDRLVDAIEDRFGFRVPVVVRSSTDLDPLTIRNPFLRGDSANPHMKNIHVLFLAEEPTAEAAASLDPERSPGDAFLVSGSEVFVSYEHGMSRTRLTTDYIERCLGVSGTARNWRTVNKIHEMAMRTEFS